MLRLFPIGVGRRKIQKWRERVERVALTSFDKTLTLLADGSGRRIPFLRTFSSVWHDLGSDRRGGGFSAIEVCPMKNGGDSMTAR